MAATSVIIKEGTLLKRGGSNKNKGGNKNKWKKRYFIFTGGSLFVYDSPTVTHPPCIPLSLSLSLSFSSSSNLPVSASFIHLEFLRFYLV
jgi:hypothetical protein